MTIRSRTVDATPTLGSLLLGSADPTRLRDWYEKAFGVAVDTFGFHDFGGVGLMPDHRDDVAARATDPGRVILNFDVPDAKAAVEQIDKAGTTWVMPLTDNPEGKFATFTDPDGNYLQVIELSHDMQQRMLAGPRDDWRNTKPFSGIAVDDTAAAKVFYSTVIGLDVTEKYGILALWLDARSCVLAYPKPGHVPAQHTVLNFPVDDIETAVDDLVAAGVTMLRYDGMKQDAKGIMREGGPLIGWFADPAGNILSVLQDK